MSESRPITSLLRAAAAGDADADARLLELVYRELHVLADRLLRREAADCSVAATMLVHDAWLHLCGDSPQAFERRAHFFGAAARAMRRLLVDRSRRRAAERRGGGVVHVTLTGIAAPRGPLDAVEVLSLHEALTALEHVAPAAARVVELRYFAGMSIEQAAQALDLGSATVKRQWAYARAFLHDRMRNQGV